MIFNLFSIHGRGTSPLKESDTLNRILQAVPGVLGAALVTLGVWFIFWPAALIVAGGFCLAVDWRLSR